MEDIIISLYDLLQLYNQDQLNGVMEKIADDLTKVSSFSFRRNGKIMSEQNVVEYLKHNKGRSFEDVEDLELLYSLIFIHVSEIWHEELNGTELTLESIVLFLQDKFRLYNTDAPMPTSFQKLAESIPLQRKMVSSNPRNIIYHIIDGGTKRRTEGLLTLTKPLELPKIDVKTDSILEIIIGLCKDFLGNPEADDRSDYIILSGVKHVGVLQKKADFQPTDLFTRVLWNGEDFFTPGKFITLQEWEKCLVEAFMGCLVRYMSGGYKPLIPSVCTNMYARKEHREVFSRHAILCAGQINEKNALDIRCVREHDTPFTPEDLAKLMVLMKSISAMAENYLNEGNTFPEAF